MSERLIEIKGMYKKATDKIAERYEPYPECWDYMEEKYPSQYLSEKKLDKMANDESLKYIKDGGSVDVFREALKTWYLFWMEYLKLYVRIRKRDDRNRTT